MHKEEAQVLCFSYSRELHLYASGGSDGEINIRKDSSDEQIKNIKAH